MSNKIITSKVAAATLDISVQQVRNIAKKMGKKPEISNAYIFTPAELKKMQARNTNVGRPKKEKK